MKPVDGDDDHAAVVAVASKLRVLALECARISRDMTDLAVGNQIEAISVELALSAEVLQQLYTER